MLSRIFSKKQDTPNSFTALEPHEKALFQMVDQKSFDSFQQTLASTPVKINLKDQEGNTFLMHAADDDDKLVFTEYLLAHGADVNAVNNKGFTAVFQAAYWNSKETVKVLVKVKKIELDAENKVFGFPLSPLTGAIFKDHYEVAKQLLYRGASPYKAEKIIQGSKDIFKNAYNEKYQNLIEFYKRWHEGKKNIVIALYLREHKTDEQQIEEKVKLFDVGLVPRDIIAKIADDYL